MDEFVTAARHLVEELQTAWNTADAVRFSDLFAEDADFIHILGGHGRGRRAIAAAHEALFSGIYRGSTVRFDLESVRSLGSLAFIALLTQHLHYSTAAGAQAMTCRPSAVVQKQDRWRIVLFQNTRSAEVLPPALAGHPFAPT